MASVEMTVTYRVHVRLACAWIRLLAIIAPLVGRGRALDWALRGAKRLMRVRIIGVR